MRSSVVSRNRCGALPSRLKAGALLLLSLLLACVSATASEFAEAPRAPLNEYYAERWSSRDGLPHNMVSGLVQAPDGYLWLATLEGAVRYSGREFRVFDAGSVEGLRGNAVRAVAVDSRGSVLLATTRDGVARKTDQGWEFLRLKDQVVIDATISITAGADGRIWAGGENSGVVRFEADGGQRSFGVADGLPSGYVNAMVEDTQGRLWVGTTRGLALIEGDRVSALGPGSGLDMGLVLSLQLLDAERVLVGTDRGLFIGTRDGGFERFSERMPQDQINRLLLDARGDLWVGTASHGLLRVSAPLGPSSPIERIDVQDGLPNSRVSALAQDSEGSVWVGTNGGLFRLRLPPVRVFSQRQGLATPYVRAVAETTDGSLWAGTSSGLFRLSAEGVKGYWAADGLPSDSVMSLLAEPDGALLIGTAAAGLARWDGQRIVGVLNRAGGLAGDQVRALLRTRDGTLWVGTTLGLSELRDGRVRNWTVAEGLPRDFVIALHEDAKGRLFVGTSNGAALIEDGRLRVLSLGTDPVKDIFYFHETADGSVWMATDLGLLRWREGPAGRVGRAAGLPVDAIFQIVPDALGGWWLTSNRGLYRIDAAAAAVVADGRRAELDVRHFNESDGMENAQCNGAAGPAALVRADGRLWFGTASGFAVVDPPAVLLSRVPRVPAVIEAVRVDDAEAALLAAIQVPAGSRRIEIELAGLSLLMPERIQFRYRLAGFEEDFIEMGARDTLQFTALRPGRYQFEAQARNPEGQWGESARIELEVLPFWWQRGSVQVLALLALVAAAFVTVQYRIARLRRAQLRLRALVDEKTIDLATKAGDLERLARERGDLADRLHLQARAFERQANEDYLTGLLNRRAFDSGLAEAFQRMQRSGEPLCLALLDIDFFKRINDECSHAAGDSALREIAMLIREQVRSSDLASRWGGEEFALLFPGAGVDEARRVCERLRAAIEKHDFGSLQPGLKVTVSIGLASHAGIAHHEKLIQRADDALYRAKAQGRNQVVG